MVRMGDAVKGSLYLLAALLSLVLWALLDLALSMPGGMPRIPMKMTDRIRLASAATLLFPVFNFVLFRLIVPRRAIPRWSAILLAILGGVGVLYLPARTLGLPWLSEVLSSRHNPIWRVLETGGLISLVRLQLASFLVLGVLCAVRPDAGSPVNDHLNAA